MLICEFLSQKHTKIAFSIVYLRRNCLKQCTIELTGLFLHTLNLKEGERWEQRESKSLKGSITGLC